MPKRKYRLQTVLDLREREKQATASALAARRAQLAEAEAELRRRMAAVEDCRTRQVEAHNNMMAETESGVVVGGLVLHRTHLADLRRVEQELIVELEAQSRVVAAAEDEVEKALVAMIEAAREVQVIEKHHESWQHKVRREEEREQQKLGDEIGTVTHRRRE